MSAASRPLSASVQSSDRADRQHALEFRCLEIESRDHGRITNVNEAIYTERRNDVLRMALAIRT
jgi:hypothetical protein